MNPYEALPPEAFWKLAVANRSMFDIDGLWQPKFRIHPDHEVVTFGSCFAQHIGSALKARGFNWACHEPAPHGISQPNAGLFNYGVFSARTGNIYTTSLLKQWIEWALDESRIPDEVWVMNGRFYDPFRPRVEPDGFESADEMRNSRIQTVRSFRKCVEHARHFVFTLGLTESWIHAQDGHEYPMCPGTVAGDFDGTKHRFVNQRFQDVLKNLRESIKLMRGMNPRLDFILTVSPVPLTATRSGNHVVVATMESKSILRAVAGQVSANLDCVDYFPSYEIINSPVFRGAFFDPNLRNVNHYGVNFVMDRFFAPLEQKSGESPPRKRSKRKSKMKEVCEEELLEAFGKQP